MIASRPAGTGVRLSVMLDRATSSSTESVARELATAAHAKGAPLVLAASRMILLDTTLAAVEEVVRQPEVVWVDTNTEARLEELLDK